MIAIDTLEQMSLAIDNSHMEIVGPTVFAVGADDKYIVVKQHPSTNDFGDFDRSKTNYFIVDQSVNAVSADGQAGVMGPLSEAEFVSFSTTKSLPSFTKTIKDLE